MKGNFTRRLLICAASAGALFHSMGLAQAAEADYPSRPIRLIVPFATGGGVDLLARVFAKDLGDRLGQSVVVENKAGAGGNIGMGMTAKAPADGYTIVMVSSTFVINPFLYASVPYDAKTSFAPIINLVGAPTVLVANPKSGVQSVQQLFDIAKRKPDSLNYASAGIGTSQHLAGELLRMSGLEWAHIPYNGAGPSVAAVLSNEVPFGFSSLPAVSGHIKTGHLRALAVTTRQRDPSLPDVPTFVEAGYPKVVVEYFQALLAPAGTPAAIVDRLARVSNDILRSPEMAKQISDMGFTVIGGTPAEFAAQIDSELIKWKEVVAASGAKVE
ncbi:tripartite tricarboxylate transporter substrate binding protein [Pigmentiphaga soli]